MRTRLWAGDNDLERAICPALRDHCGVEVTTPHSVGFACLVPLGAGKLFTVPSDFRLFTTSSMLSK
jgi:hypothetical protein